MIASADTKETIRRHAFGLGFDDCRFTSAEPPASAPHFSQWLQNGFQAGMAYLQRTESQRRDPQQVLTGAKTVIVLAANYASPMLGKVTGPSRANERTGLVARYARFTDYHGILEERLEKLGAFVVHTGGPATRSVRCVDAGPVLERDLAQRAGLGFVGKHTDLISRRFGNWLLLAEVFTTMELEPDPPARNRCGACTRCLSACPTGALVAPFQLDARRCLSYLTIENKGAIPVELRPALGTRVFGCDDCLAACPWNRFAQAGRLMQSHFRPDLAEPDLRELLGLDEAAFRRRFAGTPIQRAKRRGLLRNVCVALGNAGAPESLSVLVKAANDPEPLIAEHARWAIAQITS